MNLRCAALFALLATFPAGCCTYQVLDCVAPAPPRPIRASVRGAAAWRIDEGLHVTLAYDHGPRERWDVQRPPAAHAEHPWRFVPCAGGDEHALSDWPALVPFGTVRIPASDDGPELVLREVGGTVRLVSGTRRLASKELPLRPPRTRGPAPQPGYLLLLPFAFVADVALLPAYGVAIAVLAFLGPLGP